MEGGFWLYKGLPSACPYRHVPRGVFHTHSTTTSDTCHYLKHYIFLYTTFMVDFQSNLWWGSPSVPFVPLPAPFNQLCWLVHDTAKWPKSWHLNHLLRDVPKSAPDATYSPYLVRLTQFNRWFHGQAVPICLLRPSAEVSLDLFGSNVRFLFCVCLIRLTLAPKS